MRSLLFVFICLTSLVIICYSVIVRQFVKSDVPVQWQPTMNYAKTPILLGEKRFITQINSGFQHQKEKKLYYQDEIVPWVTIKLDLQYNKNTTCIAYFIDEEENIIGDNFDVKILQGVFPNGEKTWRFDSLQGFNRANYYHYVQNNAENVFFILTVKETAKSELKEVLKIAVTKKIQ